VFAAQNKTRLLLSALWKPPTGSHLDQVALRREAEAVDGVGPAVGPLAKLLRCLGERHVGG